MAGIYSREDQPLYACGCGDQQVGITDWRALAVEDAVKRERTGRSAEKGDLPATSGPMSGGPLVQIRVFPQGTIKRSHVDMGSIGDFSREIHIPPPEIEGVLRRHFRPD